MVGSTALTRRLGAVVIALAAIALQLGTAAPAQAHGGLILTVRGDGRGAVSVDVAWSDGHPVAATEPMAGTLVAVSSAGGQAGPAPLRRLPGSSTVVYAEPLKPGSWQVTVDLAMPGIGHCVADVVVAASAAPSSQRCGEPVAPAAAPASPAPGADGVSPLVLLFSAAGVIALGTLAAVIASRRRQPAPGSRPARRR